MLSPRKLILVAFVANIFATGKGKDCVPRQLEYGLVCVCNSTYCDSAAVDVPEKGQYRSYESSEDGKRMDQKVGNFSDNETNDNSVDSITISLDFNQKFQKIHGFGGAFTDSAGINIKSLSQGTQDRLFETYFGQNGSRYNLGRVPIAGTDFSTHPYTYDDTPDDVHLANFALPMEDLEYKIPFMSKALEINPSLKFVSAAWTAPPWMKTNNYYYGFGYLKTEYYQAYADYLMKFLVEYKNRGLPIWAISTGNEPLNSFKPGNKITSMVWIPHTVRTWIAENFGPTIANSELNDTVLLIVEDQRISLPWFVSGIFKNPIAKNYTTGIAVHWYMDSFITARVLDNTHDMYPDKFLIMTEACVGSSIAEWPKVRLGDWHRGERYILSIIENLSHWMTGWMDWNLALDKNGGPTWISNFVDSPIIVNPESDEFFKQPMYYALAHFSKFVSRGSTRIGSTKNSCVENIAFVTSANETVVVLYNEKNEEKSVIVKDPEQGYISMKLGPHTIKTLIYKR